MQNSSLEMSEQYEPEPELRCSVCKCIGKGTTTSFNDEGDISKLFICECGHEEIL